MIAHLDLLPFPFLSDSWNILDMLIFFISLLSVSNIAGQNGGVKAFLRCCTCSGLTFENTFKGLAAIVIPVLNTFFVMLIATSVFAVLGFGLFSERPTATKYFGHFPEAFFTMFQFVSGDG